MTTTLWQRLKWTVRPTSFSVSLFLGTGVMLILWLIEGGLRFIANADGKAHSHGQVLLFLTCGFLVLVSWVQALTLADAARVFRQKRVPRPIWRGWLEKVLLETTAVWAVLMLFCLALPRIAVSPTNQDWSDLHQAALFSVLLGCMLLVQMSYSRHLHWACGVVAATVLLWIGLEWQGPIKPVLSTLPAPSLWLAVAVWPMVAAALWWHWQQPRGADTSARDLAPSRLGWWRWRTGYEKRFIVLQHVDSESTKQWSLWRRIEGVQYTFRTAGSGQAVLWGIASPKLLGWTEIRPGLLHSDGWVWLQRPINVLHLIILAVLTVLYTYSLVYKDLTWRTLLAPGGVRRGRMGWHIVRSTASLGIFYLTVMLVVSQLLAFVFNSGWPPRAELRHLGAQWAQTYAVIVLEMLCAISIATVLQGVRAWTARGMVILVALALFWAWQAWPAGAALFTSNLIYITSLLLGTFLCIALANRLWTVEKLMRYVRA